MSGLICVVGGKGAPGASTLALGLALAAAQERSINLVDADPDGGGLAARLGVASTPGLVSLSAAARHGFHSDLVDLHTQQIGPGLDLLAGPPSAEQTCSALGGLGQPFAEALAARDAIADVGRWQLRSPATDLVREATAAVLVIQPSLEDHPDGQVLPSRAVQMMPTNTQEPHPLPRSSPRCQTRPDRGNTPPHPERDDEDSTFDTPNGGLGQVCRISDASL